MKGGGRMFGFGEKDKAEKADPMPIEILKKQLASTTTEMNELIEALNNVMWLRNDWKHFIIPELFNRQRINTVEPLP